MRDLIKGVEHWGLEISQQQIQSFQTYYEELTDWNVHSNLTAISGCRQVQVRHFLDCLSCLLVLDRWFPSAAPLSVIDIGTGAGFPGMVLKLVRPDWNVTLVDSVRKKTRFLEHMVQVLQLTNVIVLRTRAETLGQDSDYREQYDLAMARAVASLPVLAEYLLPLCRLGGVMLAQKGAKARSEVEAAQATIDNLGGRLIEMRRADVPGLDETRFLVVVEKIAPTPMRYPRRPGVPAKCPLSQ